MIILAIIVLFIISLALRVVSSGVSTLQKVNNRVIQIGSKVTTKATDKAADVSSKALSKASPSNSEKVNKAKSAIKKGKNTAIKVGSKGVKVVNKAVGRTTVSALKIARLIVDAIRRLLMVILPVVVVVDVIAFVLLITVARSITSLFNDSISSDSYSGEFVISDNKSDDNSGNSSSNGDIGNASLAEAAVSLAGSCDTPIYFDGVWGPDSPALNCPELKLYKEQHDKAAPWEDQYYASCDRGVFTAVRYAGLDDDFPMGPVSAAYNHMSSSDKWKYIGVDDGNTELKPGDILCISGKHIYMYVGNEAVRKKFPDSDADYYEASYSDYFPYVFKGNHNGYNIFRYVGG